MLRLPQSPSAPALTDQVLRVEFKSATEHGTAFVAETGAFFHYGPDEQRGAVEVVGLRRILNDGFPDTARGFYHSGQGLFLEVPARHFLPPELADNRWLCLHCRRRNDRWSWRLVRCLPTAQRRNLVRELLITAAETFRNRLLVRARFSRLAGAEATNVPEWGEEPSDADQPAEAKPGLDLGLSGAWLELDLSGAPLRLALSRLKTSRESDGGWTVTLREETDGRDRSTTVTHTLLLDPKLDRVAALKGPNGQPWSLTVNPVQPVWHETARPSGVATDPAEDRGASPTGGAEEKPGAPPRPAAAADGLWLSTGDEWFHLPVATWAVNPVAAESRRWRLSALLPPWAAHLDVHVWLDNCGVKELRLRFDSGSKLVGVELGFEKLFVSAEARQGFLPGSWLNVPDRPPCPDLERRWTLPGPLGLLSVNDGAYSLRLDHSSAQLSSATAPVTHWARSAFGLIGPVRWAANDPGATNGLSALRGLLPLQRPTCTVEFRAEDVTASVPKKAAFPDFALGARLFAVRTGDARLSAELEIQNAETALVRHRHANPHLDAPFALPTPALNGGKPTNLPEELTWVRERYADGKVVQVKAAQILALNLGPAPAAPESKSPTTDRAPLRSVNSAFFSLVWRRAPARWDARLSDALRAVLEGSGLIVHPLRLRFGDDGQPCGLEFRLEPGAPLDPALVQRTLEADLQTPESLALKGSVALPAAWLAGHHRGLEKPILWPERATDPGIAFLGLESSAVSLAEGDLRLANVRYWFRLDGLALSIESEDELALGGGNWWFVSLSPLLSLQPPEAGATVASFSLPHAIAPGLVLREHLLGEPAGTLELEYAQAAVRFDVRTTYHPPPSVPPQQPVALLRAGAYHLAWAGLAGTRTSPFPGGFEFNELTRVFLHLTRDRAGRLAATGMAGWQCGKIPPGFASEAGRATLYASRRGEWTRLRLSGKWTDPADTKSPLRSLVLFRHDLALTSKAPDTVTVERSLTPWLIAEHAASSDGDLVHCYHGCAWQDGTLKLSGAILLLPETTNTAGESPATEIERARAAVQLRLLTPAVARWRLDADAALDHAPLRLRPPTLDTLPQELPQAGLHADGPETNLTAVGNARFGLTHLNDGSWLLCPIRESRANLFDDESPKLWVFHEDGEDMVQLEGFLEKIGPLAHPRARLDLATLQRRAEETLTFLRWRKPAVLESWGPGPDGGSERIPTWTLVDAPLLNVFSELDFMSGRHGDRLNLAQPDPGLVTHRLPAPPETQPGPIPQPWPAERDLAPQTTVEVDPNGHPCITARLGGPAPILESVVQVRRETPFELGDPTGDWSADPTRWVGATASTETTKPDPATVLLPPTDWRFACPRPGERQGVAFEVSATDVAGAPQVAPFASAQVRSPRADVREVIVLETPTPSDRCVRWRLASAATPSRSGVTLRVLAGYPNRRELRSGSPWPLAVAGSPGALPDGVAVAVQFTSEQPFEVRVGEVSCRADGDAGKSALWLVVGTGAYGRALPVIVIPGSERVQISAGVARLPGSGATVSDWQFLATGLASVDAPADVAIPNPRFTVVPTAQTDTLLPPLPHVIGLLTQGRVTGYGPCLLELDVEFTPDKQDCAWVFKGAWTPNRSDWVGPPDALVAIRPDGSVNSYP